MTTIFPSSNQTSESLLMESEPSGAALTDVPSPMVASIVMIGFALSRGFRLRPGLMYVNMVRVRYTPIEIEVENMNGSKNSQRTPAECSIAGWRGHGVEVERAGR